MEKRVYRIVRWADGSLGLHEVFLTEDGRPHRIMPMPAFFLEEEAGCPENLLRELRRAATEAASRPVLGCGDVPGHEDTFPCHPAGVWTLRRIASRPH